MAEVKGPMLNAGDALKPAKAGSMNNQTIASIVVGGLILVAIVMGQLRQPPDLTLKKGPPKTLSINVEQVDKEIFVKSAGERIEALERERDQLTRTRDLEMKDREQIKAQISDLSTRLSELKTRGVTAVSGGPRGTGFSGPPGSFPPLPPPLSPITSPGGPVVPVSLPVPKGVSGVMPSTGGSVGPVSGEPSQSGIHVLFKADPAVIKKAAEKKFWLNTGTIIPVKLISGMDAPAKAGQGGGRGSGAGPSASPYPVLMVIRDLAKLPNDVTIDARECFILGEGIGELSSERVQIRGTTLSCVKTTGEAVDIELKGFVNGEDSKLGLRGRVVFKEGAVLGRALLAGFISGISQAFMPYQQGMVISGSPSQAFQMPAGGPVAMAGAAGGLGNAARLLAKHYSQMAASIYPIIEIDANRDVDFIVGTGRELADFFL